MKINIYTDENKFLMHTREYQIIWQMEGEKIENAFNKILGLNFNEKSIKLLINYGANDANLSGETKSEIMNFRYNNRSKIGTFLHELSHRIVMEYKLMEIAKKKFGIEEVHELIDLFLYDIIELLYGSESAKLRVEYESNFEDEIYKKSWLKALSFTFEERQNILKKIKEEL